MFCLDAREGHAACTTSLREFCLYKYCNTWCARGGMATHALPALGLNSLPSDILMLILRLLPLVPRVRTISILNKRLRELVYRSIDALTDYPQHRMRYRAPHYYKALSRLTSLTALNLRVTPSWPTTYVLPASLRHLGLRSRRHHPRAAARTHIARTPRLRQACTRFHRSVCVVAPPARYLLRSERNSVTCFAPLAFAYRLGDRARESQLRYFWLLHAPRFSARDIDATFVMEVHISLNNTQRALSALAHTTLGCRNRLKRLGRSFCDALNSLPFII